MHSNSDSRTVTDIVRDLLAETSTLFRKESQLARAEVAEKADQVVRGMGLTVLGAALAIPGITVLLGAAVTALVDTGIDARWAALAVGVAALVIGILCAWFGARAMRADRLL